MEVEIQVKVLTWSLLKVVIVRFQKKVGVVKDYFLSSQEDQKEKEIFLVKIVMIPEKGCWEVVVIAA